MGSVSGWAGGSVVTWRDSEFRRALPPPRSMRPSLRRSPAAGQQMPVDRHHHDCVPMQWVHRFGSQAAQGLPGRSPGPSGRPCPQAAHQRLGAPPPPSPAAGAGCGSGGEPPGCCAPVDGVETAPAATARAAPAGPGSGVVGWKAVRVASAATCSNSLATTEGSKGCCESAPSG
jgi:hypothetical protein